MGVGNLGSQEYGDGGPTLYWHSDVANSQKHDPHVFLCRSKFAW